MDETRERANQLVRVYQTLESETKVSFCTVDRQSNPSAIQNTEFPILKATVLHDNDSENRSTFTEMGNP